MFQWSITLTDKQVLMLAAFAAAEPDARGNQFHSVHAMIADAWDIRAVRKLQEYGLIEVVAFEDPDTKMQTNRWSIKEKGRFIAAAMREDTNSLTQMKLREGRDSMYRLNRDFAQHEKKRKTAKKNATKSQP
jgi:hypothetical protein